MSSQKKMLSLITFALVFLLQLVCCDPTTTSTDAQAYSAVDLTVLDINVTSIGLTTRDVPDPLYQPCVPQAPGKCQIRINQSGIGRTTATLSATPFAFDCRQIGDLHYGNTGEKLSVDSELPHVIDVYTYDWHYPDSVWYNNKRTEGLPSKGSKLYCRGNSWTYLYSSCILPFDCEMY